MPGAGAGGGEVNIRTTRLILSLLVLAAVLGVLYIRVSGHVDLGTAQVEDVILAGLVGAFTTVMAYYFKD